MRYITNSSIGHNGRLGNQLFQFASLFGLSMKSDNKALRIPSGNIKRVSQRFADGEVKTVGLDIQNVFPLVGQQYVSPIDLFVNDFKTLTEQSFTYDKRLAEICLTDNNINLSGYFQSPRYFEEFRSELLDVLTFPSLERKRAEPLVSLHVRRKDYLSLSNNHPVCGPEYYEKAMSHFDGCKFLIFSDDIAWCKENLPKDICMFSEGETEGDDLMKMSYCNHHIIANSSFSWWGAYLNKSKNKEIIAPAKWFGPAYSNYDTSEILSITTKIL